MPRTIYILDEIWDEFIHEISFANPFAIKSGFDDDLNGIRIKPTMITTLNISFTISLINCDLTVENI
jgi:hypothetical protein